MNRPPTHKLVAAALLAALVLVPLAAGAAAWFKDEALEDVAHAAGASEDALLVDFDAALTVEVAGLEVSRSLALREESPVPLPPEVAGVEGQRTRVNLDSDEVAPEMGGQARDLLRARLDVAAGVLTSASGDGLMKASDVVVSDVAETTPAVVLWAAAAALGLAGAAAWFWPHLKKLLIAVPLYAHISRSEVFENEVRERIFGFVKSDPGVCASELSRRANVSWGTTMYHLDVLEQTRMVSSVKSGRYRRYFANGATIPGSKSEVAILRNERTAEIARTLALKPGLTQKELSRETRMSPQALHWHMSRLDEAGLVRKVREGRVVRHFVSAVEA